MLHWLRILNFRARQQMACELQAMQLSEPRAVDLARSAAVESLRWTVVLLGLGALALYVLLQHLYGQIVQFTAASVLASLGLVAWVIVRGPAKRAAEMVYLLQPIAADSAARRELRALAAASTSVPGVLQATRMGRRLRQFDLVAACEMRRAELMHAACDALRSRQPRVRPGELFAPNAADSRPYTQPGSGGR